MSRSKIVPAEFRAVPEIAEALQLAEESSYSEGELNTYQAYWRAVSTEKTLFEGRYREGKAEGILLIAKRLLASGMSIEQVAKLTDLSSAHLIQIHLEQPFK